jgi:hypothetical protein
MKIINKINLTLLFTLFGSFISLTCAQENGVASFNISFDMSSVKQEDNSRLFKVEFSGTNENDKKDVVSVVDAEVNFYNILDDQEILLGKSKTSKEGVVSIVVPATHKYLKDNDGFITVIAKYDGNDVMDPQESELMFKDLFLEIELNTEDSIRTVKVNAYTMDIEGEKQDVETLDIVIGVKGMLSKLVLEESTLENGVYEYELPDDIHGNSMGDLTIFVKVDENADFGNLIKTTTVKDVYAINKPVTERNKLWTDAAPIWMYIVLSILLIVVWSNYLISVINLIKINKTGKS